MIREARIHARAGQGAITTAEILGTAIFIDGGYAYAFPSFGAARMGAPMNAFVRISDRPIRLRSQVNNPDYVLVVDPTLVRTVDVLAGVKEDGLVVVNSPEPLTIDAPRGIRVCYVDANEIAMRYLGRPLGNTALLGAFAALSGAAKQASMEEVIHRRFPGEVGEKNIAALREGWEAGCK